MLNTDFPPCEAKSLMAELSTRATRGALRLWHVWNICCRNSSQNCIKNTRFPSITANYLKSILESRAWAGDHETCRNGVLTVKSEKEMTICNSVEILVFRRVGHLVKSSPEFLLKCQKLIPLTAIRLKTWCDHPWLNQRSPSELA